MFPPTDGWNTSQTKQALFFCENLGTSFYIWKSNNFMQVHAQALKTKLKVHIKTIIFGDLRENVFEYILMHFCG